MISPLARARLAGGAFAVAIFALGVAAGTWAAGRDRPGINISVVATDHMPRELERLGLAPAQQPPIHEALMRGRARVMRVTDELQSRMQAAVDSTDQEIRPLLSNAQRASFDSARRVNGPPLRRKRVIVTK